MTNNDIKKTSKNENIKKDTRTIKLAARKIESIISKFKDIHDDAIKLKLVDGNFPFAELSSASDDDQDQTLLQIKSLYLEIIQILANQQANLNLRKIVLEQEIGSLSAPSGKNSGQKLQPVSILLAVSQKYEMSLLQNHLDVLTSDITNTLETIINYRFDGVKFKYDNENNALEVSYAANQMELLSDMTRQSLIRRLAELDILMHRLLENWVENIKRRSVNSFDLNEEFNTSLRDQISSSKLLMTDDLIKEVDELSSFDNLKIFNYQARPNTWVYISQGKWIPAIWTFFAGMRSGIFAFFMPFMVLNLFDINVKGFFKSLIPNTFVTIMVLTLLVLLFIYLDYRANKRLAVDSMEKAKEQIRTALNDRLSQFRSMVATRFRLISKRKASEFENLVEQVKQQKTTNGGSRNKAGSTQKTELLSTLKSRLSELSRFEKKIANLGKDLEHDA